ncbi:MAG: SagB/ThcOx family dehydrogenase [Thermoleophilia bacterium]|nr:SagB/ThcOx family dehydrogenase [Thermoleophilia bacterium]
MIALPKPRKASDVSLEFCLQRRRSIREYRVRPLTLQQVSQLLWAAQGITHARGYRTAPSAGALYPMEIFLNAWEVEGLQAGLYWYSPARHELEHRSEAVPRKDLARAALDQDAIRLAPAVFVIAAVYGRTTKKYGERGIRYVHMEAGHVAQNLCLQATALNLGTVTIGAFYDNQVKRLLGLRDEDPLYLLPVGHP